MAAPALAADATATLTPSTGLAFGNVKVGTTSNAKTAKLTNSSGSVEAFTINSTSAPPPFAVVSNACGSPLDPGSSCTISVVFKPTSSGAKSGTLDVSTDATDPPGGNLSIPLSGTGTLPGAKLSATSVSFGNWGVGVISSPKTLKLTNSGKAALKIMSISTSGDFKQSNDCGSSLGAGNACTITITFKPSKLGSRTGTLTVKDDAPSGTQTASLSGTGVNPTVVFDPTSLDFRIQRIHTTSFVRSATLTNKGRVTLVISDISTSKPYAQTNTCGSSLPAGGTCTISVTFAPSKEGVFDGSVTVADNAGTQQLALTGLGGFPAFSAKQTSLAFRKQGVGTSSLPKDVKLTNTGTDKLFITSITIKGDFSQTNTCQPYINPGITCAVSVTFTPKEQKARKGVLTIDHELGVYNVSLSGTGIPVVGPTQASTVPTTNPAPGTTGQPISGRRLPGSLKLIGVVGLLLLLGGGAFVWATRRGERQGDGEPALRLEPKEEGGVEQLSSLDELLSGIENPYGSALVGALVDAHQAPGKRSVGVEEAKAAPKSDDERDEPLPGDVSFYDWASDPESPLV